MTGFSVAPSTNSPLAYLPEQFDFINQVIEHLGDPVGICRNLVALLRPEGILRYRCAELPRDLPALGPAPRTSP
jgi:2-polyprenyl-3-methyl-5-hydroxy-6-metoxy-1,4-benzoquinol methylase